MGHSAKSDHRHGRLPGQRVKRIDTECLGTWMRSCGEHRREEDAFRSRCDRRRQFVLVMSSSKEEAISWPGCRPVVAVRAPIVITG